jgi:hypothetical protein
MAERQLSEEELKKQRDRASGKLRLSPEELKKQEQHFEYIAHLMNAIQVGKHFQMYLDNLPKGPAANKSSSDSHKKVMAYLDELKRDADEVARKFHAQSIT